MRQLRVENTLYNLTYEVWRQVNDLLSKAEGTTHLTQDMLRDEIPLETEGSGSSLPTGSGSGPESPDEPKTLGEDLSDEEKP